MVTGKNVKRVVKKPLVPIKATAKIKPTVSPAGRRVPKATLKTVAKPTVKSAPKPPPKVLPKSLIVTKAGADEPALSTMKTTTSIKSSLPEVKGKIKKTKLIRDSFTMPADEYQVLGDVKKTFLRAGLEVKKSELLRIGVALIRDLDLANLKRAVAGLRPVKAGRPKKEK